MDSAFPLSGAAAFLSRCSAYRSLCAGCFCGVRRNRRGAARAAERAAFCGSSGEAAALLRAASPPSKARRDPVGVFADLPREREKQHFPYGCGVAAEWERARGIESRKADVSQRPPAAVTSFLQVCRSYRETCRDKSRGCSCRQARILCSSAAIRSRSSC